MILSIFSLHDSRCCYISINNFTNLVNCCVEVKNRVQIELYTNTYTHTNNKIHTHQGGHTHTHTPIHHNIPLITFQLLTNPSNAIKFHRNCNCQRESEQIPGNLLDFCARLDISYENVCMRERGSEILTRGQPFFSVKFGNVIYSEHFFFSFCLLFSHNFEVKYGVSPFLFLSLSLALGLPMCLCSVDLSVQTYRFDV